MKYIKTFESYKITKKREEIISESVMQVNDIYKVKTTIDVSQSLINAYAKKVKDTSGVNLKTYFGDVDLAEEIVKYINGKFLAADQIPSNALIGGPQGEAQAEAQVEEQPQVQPEVQPQAEVQPEAQIQPEVQPEAQVQEVPSSEEFEEPKTDEEEQEEELPQ